LSDGVIGLINITKLYGHIKALNNISLSINKSDFITIFGPNGAGKSTLLKILSYQTKASSGDIQFSGISYKNLQSDFRSNLGVISHQPFLYENLTAFENLRFYSTLYNVQSADTIITDLLKKVDLYKRKDDQVGTFSRGMLQRVSIIRALLHNPDIILLDEPYTGLDAVASTMLTSLLQDQLSNKKTIIMVTHDLNIGLNLASRVIIMNKGRIVYNEDKSNIDKSDFERTYLEYASANSMVV